MLNVVSIGDWCLSPYCLCNVKACTNIPKYNYSALIPAMPVSIQLQRILFESYCCCCLCTDSSDDWLYSSRRMNWTKYAAGLIWWFTSRGVNSHWSLKTDGSQSVKFLSLLSCHPSSLLKVHVAAIKIDCVWLFEYSIFKQEAWWLSWCSSWSADWCFITHMRLRMILLVKAQVDIWAYKPISNFNYIITLTVKRNAIVIVKTQQGNDSTIRHSLGDIMKRQQLILIIIIIILTIITREYSLFIESQTSHLLVNANTQHGN